ncbi:hypothetical protein BHE74_00022574 [Ensete ventricosum]|nr:hypothetical protein GW17_00031370 [Ensete ventricosum]RWW69789.1 hypothetical protein BHE74_00022574 [Ensete ventricosum]RZS15647.1 hypothetical protein BHM03_00047507 [Ensete ventricosum]
MYHRGRISSASTSDSYRGMIGAAKELDCSSAHIRLRELGVLDQGTKYAVRGVVSFLLRGVGDKDDGEDGIIPKVTKTIKDLLQVGVKFCSFRAKLLAFGKFDGRG